MNRETANGNPDLHDRPQDFFRKELSELMVGGIPERAKGKYLSSPRR
jgi:hypothetical protein